MTVRVHRKERFTSVSNDIINNKEMSWEARGLLIYLLSKPPGWIIRNADLIKQSPAGRDKITSIVHELVRHGHIFRWQTRDSDGRIEWKSEIFETPEEMIEWKSENPDICGKFAHSIAETSSQTENHNGKTVHGGKSHHDGKTVDGKSAHHDGKTVSGSTVNGEPVDIVNTERSNTEFSDLKDLNPLTHSDPERVCAQESQIEQESSDETNKTKNLPVLPPTIGEDHSSAASSISPIEGFPIGPWGRDLLSIHPGFMAAVIAKWRKGDTQKAKTFGAMVDEEVRGCIQKYWKKDWTNLLLDWTEYEESTKRLAQTVRDRMAQGVEITSEEQKILTDRVMGPEHLRSQTAHSVPRDTPLNLIRAQDYIAPSDRVLPVALSGGLSEEDLAETQRAIEKARSSLVTMHSSLFEGRVPIAPFMTWLEAEAKKYSVLFEGRVPIAPFMTWLEAEAKKYSVPGMSKRAIA